MPRSRRRTRHSETEWSEILKRFESSGLTVRDFCRREQLSPSSFQRWRSRLRQVTAPEFVELVESPAAAATTPGWSLDVALPNGVQLRFRG